MIRKFRAKKTTYGLDDGGVASFTFKVTVTKEGDVYEEHQRYKENSLETYPSGFVIDDNGCWNKIGTQIFNELFEEIN